jgi:hypothetical protein
LRELTRQRRQLIQARAAVANRNQKVLEHGGVIRRDSLAAVPLEKLHRVAVVERATAGPALEVGGVGQGKMRVVITGDVGTGGRWAWAGISEKHWKTRHFVRSRPGWEVVPNRSKRVENGRYR